MAIRIVIVGALLAMAVVPALAQDSGSSDPNGNLEPAVTVTTPAAEPPKLDWTYRYMIPAGLVLGVVVIVLTSGQYFISVVRKRYRIVDE